VKKIGEGRGFFVEHLRRHHMNNCLFYFCDKEPLDSKVVTGEVLEGSMASKELKKNETIGMRYAMLTV
jgi:hypothetical protein